MKCLNFLQKQPFVDVLENMFLKISQLYSKETSTQVFSCEFCEFFQNSFFFRTPPVAVQFLLLLFHCSSI